MSARKHPGKRTDAYRCDPNDLVIVGLDTEDTEMHPLYDERIHNKPTEQFIKNIMHHGVLVPVSVRRNGDKFEVIDGRTRVIAARVASERLQEQGLPPLMLLASLAKPPSDGALVTAVVASNEHRHEDTPMNRARKAARMQAYGQDIEQIAEAFNVGQQTINNWLNLLDLSPKVQKAIDAGQLSASAAAPLAELERKEQNEKLVELIEAAPAGKKVTATRTRAAVSPDKVSPPSRRVLKKALKDAASMATLNADEQQLMAYFATGRMPEDGARCSEALRNIAALLETLGG